MLRDEIKLKLNECLKNKDKKSVSTLRLVLAAVKDRDIAARSNGNNAGISDDEVKRFLSNKNLKLTKENSNPRPFDQKVTMDNLNTVAYLIDQIVKEDKKQNFTTTLNILKSN